MMKASIGATFRRASFRPGDASNQSVSSPLQTGGSPGGSPGGETTTAASQPEGGLFKRVNRRRSTVAGEVALVSDSIRADITDVDLKSAVAALKQGKYLLKYCRNSFTKVRSVVLDIQGSRTH